jgi:hypothetical protein
MTRRERLLATLRGEPVDRPAVNFYELNGFTQDPANADPFNIFSHPSWQPLLELTRARTDVLVFGHCGFRTEPPNPLREVTQTKEWIDEQGSRQVHRTVRIGNRTLTSHQRRDRDIDTWWTTEHLLKDQADFEAWLELPMAGPAADPDPAPVLAMDARVGDAGLVMLDTCDPLCMVAPLFHMEEYTILAMTEPALFRRALDKCAAWLFPRIAQIARVLPGRLWRIYGPEYASPPYLPPRLFAEFVVPYVSEMVRIIHGTGGFVRVHSHGRLKDILDHICATGCMGLDPIEPPHQGDVTLAYVREKYGRQLVLFGNLEIADIEGLPTAQMAEKVRTALREGTAGTGRGLVVMPSAAPYGRVLPEQTLRNYEAIVEVVDAWPRQG